MKRSIRGGCARHWITLAVVAVSLAGCSGAVREGGPAPVVKPGDRAGKSEPGQREPEVIALRPPAAPVTARPASAKAVQVLMRRADRQREVGKLDDAVVSLERALRIEPRNPDLWNRLAHVRAGQARHELVKQLAAKSNTLARGQETNLKRDNWQLIAAARRALGDTRGAREAQRKAAEL